MVLLRWLVFRVMLGAGLIKLRGDPCWRDLTCLAYHYETQPIPNPLSYDLHQLPLWFHRLEVLFNHFVELIVPWFVFAPRTLRHWAGGFLVLFQVVLIFSGNLSFLNWLTLVISIPCFDNSFFARVLPGRLVGAAARAPEAAETKARGVVLYGLAAVIAILSLNPVANMISPAQVMNTSRATRERWVCSPPTGRFMTIVPTLSARGSTYTSSRALENRRTRGGGERWSGSTRRHSRLTTPPSSTTSPGLASRSKSAR